MQTIFNLFLRRKNHPITAAAELEAAELVNEATAANEGILGVPQLESIPAAEAGRGD